MNAFAALFLVLCWWLQWSCLAVRIWQGFSLLAAAWSCNAAINYHS